MNGIDWSNDFLNDIQNESERSLRKQMIGKLMNDPLSVKETRSKNTISEFENILGKDTVYVSTSGGKDSAVLSHLAKQVDEDIKHIMFNTGLEYQATIELAKKQGAEIIKPTIGWVKSCEEHGYPVVSKNVSRRLHDIGRTPIGTCVALFGTTYGIANKWLHLTDKQFIDFPVSDYCCTEFKKKPSKKLKLNPIIGTRVEESTTRKSAWKKSGCNSYSKDFKHGVSRPISLWTNDNVEEYINKNNVELSTIYTQYEQKRTGCKICPYGAQVDGSRFDLLKQLEPKVYEHFIYKTKLGHICMISDVDIVSDEKYMIMKSEMEKEIEQWHEEHKANKYLDYKLNICLKYFTFDEIEKTLIHLGGNRTIADVQPILEALYKLKEN